MSPYLNFSFSSFDTVLLVIIVLSVLYGYFQGVAKAVSSGLSLLVTSGWIALLTLSQFRDFLNAFGAHSWVNLIAPLILIIIIMLVLKSLAAIFSQIAERTHTKIIDDVLGAIWGIIRGFAVVRLICVLIQYAGMHELLVNSVIYSLSPANNLNLF
jgi:uncharacterized membrane protein required for colicin V production